jgi:cobalamin biosynthetic protein CobC
MTALLEQRGSSSNAGIAMPSAPHESIAGDGASVQAESRPAMWRRHGGQLAEAAAAFPAAPQPWLDLSTGINPHPWAGPRADAAALRRLPDPAETAALEAAAAMAFGVADAGRVAAVPGAEAGLRLLPRLTGARSVAIVSPTYGGHAEAWRAAGREVRLIGPGEPAGDVEALLIVNPNNPDGRQTPREALIRLAAEGRRWLIVDESFVEVAPELSVAASAGGRLVVLRSFGKFYGLPGARLGFVVADPAVIVGVRAAFGDWPVCADAIAAGGAAYADGAWAAQTRARLGDGAARLDRLLARAGFEIVGGTPLFRLASSPNAAAWFERLARAGVLVRPFEAQPAWLRFGPPGAEPDWTRLQNVLEGNLQ